MTLETHQLDAIKLSIAAFFLASANFCGFWIALDDNNDDYDAEHSAINSSTLDELNNQLR
jgi:hypothetical protein